MKSKWNGGMMAFFAVAIMGLVCIAGCDKGDMIKASDAAPSMYDILKRHDAYVTADTTIDPTQKAIYLRSSALVKRMLDTALAPKTTSTATGTGTAVKPAALLSPKQRSYNEMVALEKLCYEQVKDECKRANKGKQLTYEEFHKSGPFIIDYGDVLDESERTEAMAVPPANTYIGYTSGSAIVSESRVLSNKDGELILMSKGPIASVSPTVEVYGDNPNHLTNGAKFITVPGTKAAGSKF